MKKIIIFSCGLLLSWCMNAQEQIKKNFPAQGLKHFVISNISGGIEVVGGNSDQIKIIATIERGGLREDATVAFKRDADYLLCYLQTPCSKSQADIKFDPQNHGEVQYWKKDCEWNKDEEGTLPKITYRVELPANTFVYLSTIMEGDVDVKNITGEVWASNVNGAIDLKQVSKVHRAKTINGDIDINFQNAPSVAGDFSTINGDINFKVPASLKATSSFKSFTGSFYTDLDAVDEMAPSLLQQNDKDGFKYQVEDKRQIKFAGGGVKLDFETFNGNVYLTSK